MQYDRATLVAHNITKDFMQGKEHFSILEGATLALTQGTTYALTGLSGTGKSTLLHIFAGLEDPTDGFVAYNGRDIATFSEKEQNAYLQETIGLIFQEPLLVDELSVYENVLLKGLISGKQSQELYERASYLLEAVGLGHKAQSIPTQLSGGEQQRVAVARALLMQPKFLLADEPTAHLDPVSQKNIIDLLLQFQQSSGMGLLIATHDSAMAARMDVCLSVQHKRIQQVQGSYATLVTDETRNETLV